MGRRTCKIYHRASLFILTFACFPVQNAYLTPAPSEFGFIRSPSCKAGSEKICKA